MYFVMARLDAAKFCKLDFIVNFGISPKIKGELVDLITNGGNKATVFKYLETLEAVDLLKLHKYFYWADKKLHSVFFIEDKDHICEDLLIDFREGEDEEMRFKKSEQLGSKKQAASGKGKKNMRPETAVPAGPKKIDATGHKISAADMLFGSHKLNK